MTIYLLARWNFEFMLAMMNCQQQQIWCYLYLIGYNNLIWIF